MTSPFDAWTRMMSAGLDMATIGVRVSETLTASNSVIRNRTATIDAAMRNPLAADHAELGAMVSEKVEAFGSAGASLAADMMRLQLDMIAQGTAAAAMVATGRMPTLRAANAMADRSTRMMTRAMGSGERALAPIHKKATANAKRLGRKRR